MNHFENSFEDYRHDSRGRHAQKRDSSWELVDSTDPIPLSEPLSKLELAKFALIESRMHAPSRPDMSIEPVPKRNRDVLRADNNTNEPGVQ